MNLKLLVTRLTRLCGGRQIVLTNSGLGLILTIRADYESNNVSVQLTDYDVELSDEEIMDRILTPAIAALDSKTYPERQKRKREALEAEIKETMKTDG